MGADVVTREQMKHSLDDWYRVMLQQNIEKATEMKEGIESKISGLDVDQDVLLYHALLNFRYDALVDWISVREDSFDKVESFEIPIEGFLAYYYHFFKGFHCTLISNYNEAKEQYEQAEKLLKYVANPIEHAEFHYRMGNFYYHSYQVINAIDYLKKAKEDFTKQPGYEINLALCENILGLCYVDLNQFELAEEIFNHSLNIFQQIDHEKYILMVRNNLGLLYANQNLSELAIRHLSEVTKKAPNHFRALYLEADEYLKINEFEKASVIISKGLHICNQLKNQEYQYRFMVLNVMNTNVDALEEAVIAGGSYFEREELFDCIQEYTERLADQFYNINNHEKASKYYRMSNESRKKQVAKGALK
ncbi:tetratricopeptide repeat protein [Bacillus cereus]|nr:tetratricopeptide repeat protein [Bacillus cereus]